MSKNAFTQEIETLIPVLEALYYRYGKEEGLKLFKDLLIRLK